LFKRETPFAQMNPAYIFTDYAFMIKIKVKFSPLQALEALRVVRG
jgi:hypothetical protein